jgi:hypothetical protein
MGNIATPFSIDKLVVRVSKGDADLYPFDTKREFHTRRALALVPHWLIQLATHQTRGATSAWGFPWCGLQIPRRDKRQSLAF